jgi:hypothetical protein
MRWRHLLCVAWVTITLMVAGVIGAEFATRALWPEFDPTQQFHWVPGIGSSPTLAVPNSNLRIWSPAGDYDLTVAIGPYGLRERKKLTEADANAIFVTGDQFPFGWGVTDDERFTEQLERRLAMPVYNIAMLGVLPWGDIKLVNYAERIVAYASNPEFRLRRLVIVVPIETAIKRYQDMARGISAPIPEDAALGRFKMMRQWLFQRSALYRGASQLLHGNSILRAAAAKLHVIAPPRRVLPKAVLDAEPVHQTVAQMATIAAPYDTVFAIVPAPGQLLDPQDPAEAELHTAFIAEIARGGLAYVDLLPAFERAGGAAKLLFPVELTWNEAAHAATAQALGAALSQRWPH